jgi:hypothetical protein
MSERWKKRNFLITSRTGVRRTQTLEGLERERMVLGK